MLRKHNIRHKFTLVIATLAILLLSIGSLIYLTFTPKYAHAAENIKTTDALGNDIHTYNLGISIAPSLPAGTYSTDVTITVAPN